MKLYDIHNHLIPNVDDGARSIEETMKMIHQYMDSGYYGAIVSSHYDKGRYIVEAEKVLRGVELIREELKNRNIDFEIYPGNEIQIDLDSIKDITNGKVLRLNNSRYVLCELPMMTRPNYAGNIFYEMQLNGWIPIIAHPERYNYVQNDPDWLLQFIKTGCLVQINLSSINKPDAKEVTKELLERNMVHIVGTDSHQSEWRSPKVKVELEQLKEMIGEEKFETYLSINPRKVIDNQFISANYDKIKKDENNNTKKKPWYKFWEKK